QNNGTDLAKNIAEQAMMPISKTITDPAAWSLDVESRMPAAQMIRLQMEQAGAGSDKKNDPRDSPRHPQTRMKQFRYAEAEKGRCQKICGGADQLIAIPWPFLSIICTAVRRSRLTHDRVPKRNPRANSEKSNRGFDLARAKDRQLVCQRIMAFLFRRAGIALVSSLLIFYSSCEKH